MNLNIALPKGRLGEKTFAILKSLGYDTHALEQNKRKLVFETADHRLKIMLVKAMDVPVYVERGVADIGVVGKDVLNESDARVLEMMDLKYGQCHFAIAAPAGFQNKPYQKLSVATKYLKTAAQYYASQNQEIDLIYLNGSVELAPLVGLSDVIVDLVETGKTLKENNLVVLDQFEPISARLIANEANYRFKMNAIDALMDQLKEVVQ